MSHRHSKPWIAGAFLTLISLAAITYRAHAAEPRVVEITAKRFAFSPDQITPKKGEPVTLRLHSEDVTHGFFMRKLKIDTEVEPGKTTDVTITPEVAVLTLDGQMAYRGRIDDTYPGLGQKRNAPLRRDLREALDAILAGKPVAVPRTEAVGCFIPDAP